MAKPVQTANRSRDLAVFESAPIPVAVMTLAVPTIITQLINIIYNFADTWYVGRTGSAAMVAALSVSMPVFILMAAIANLFGIGGASVISRALGRKDFQYARKTFSFCFYGGLAASGFFPLVESFRRSHSAVGYGHSVPESGENPPCHQGCQGDFRHKKDHLFPVGKDPFYQSYIYFRFPASRYAEKENRFFDVFFVFV